MEVVSLGQLVNGLEDNLFTAGDTHRLSGVVGVTAGAVPVAGNGLRVEGDDDAKVLGDAPQQEAGHPQLVTHFDSYECQFLHKEATITFTWSDLELPLSRHDLSVSTRDLDASIQASSVVSFDNIATVDVVVSNGAVVWALWSGVTLLWPSVWVS